MGIGGVVFQLDHPDVLWVSVLIAALFVWQLAVGKIRVLPAVLRCLLLLSLCLALSSPTVIERETKESLIALVDVSGSIPKDASQKMAQSLSQFSVKNRDIEVISFASSASQPTTLSGKLSAKTLEETIFESSSDIVRDETNIASALETAAKRSKSTPILLFTDGFSTTGNAAKVSRRMGLQSKPVFPILLEADTFSREGLAISSLFSAVTAQAGDREKIYASIKNSLSESQNTVVEFWLEDKKLSERKLVVEAGKEERLEILTPELKGGLQRIRAVLRNSDGTSSTRHRWISVKEKSKLLVLHGGNEDKSQLYELIRLKGYSAEHIVTDGSSKVPVDFSRFSAVVINNVAKRQLPNGFLESLNSFAKKGGGVLLVGGDKSYGLGDYIKTPLEKLSPLKFKPPQTKKKRLKVAVALVMDKSGSMGEQGRLLAAKRAAVLSVESLKDEDYITVIGFDHAPFLLVDISTVRDAKQEISKRLQSLTPSGQTNLLPALGMARQKLIRSRASRKHMIVLSDGQFSNSNSIYLNEINELKRESITISTVALGSEADLPFLRYLAQTGNGAFHHTLDPSRLPEIFVEDIKGATGEETMAERQLFPVGIGPGGLSSTRVKGYPVLKGFVETLPKKGSTLELITKRDKKIYPILASWRYGKGRVAAFTSDANGRWSQRWLRWPKFVTFWNDILDWIRSGATGRVADIDFDLRYSLSQGVLSFELVVYDENLRNAPPPPIVSTIIAPRGEQSSPSFSAAAPGRFKAEISNPESGDYKLSIRYGTTDLPPIGITLHDDSFGERSGRGINYAALEAMAKNSGGALNPEPGELKLSKSESMTKRALYLPLLALAFILVLLEAVVRERLLPKLN